MRLLLLLLALLLCPVAYGSYAPVQSRAGTSNIFTLAYSTNPTAGNLLITCIVHDSGQGTVTVLDTLGNSWTPTTDIGFNGVGGGGSGVACAFAVNTTTGIDTVTWTLSVCTTCGFVRVWVSEVSGNALTSVQDGSTLTLPQATGGSGSNNVTAGSPITTTVNGDFIFSCFAVATGPMTAGTGFTAFTASVGGIQQWQVLASAGSITPTATDGQNSDNYAAIVFAFKPLAGATASRRRASVITR